MDWSVYQRIKTSINWNGFTGFGVATWASMRNLMVYIGVSLSSDSILSYEKSLSKEYFDVNERRIRNKDWVVSFAVDIAIYKSRIPCPAWDIIGRCVLQRKQTLSNNSVMIVDDICVRNVCASHSGYSGTTRKQSRGVLSFLSLKVFKSNLNFDHTLGERRYLRNISFLEMQIDQRSSTL